MFLHPTCNHVLGIIDVIIKKNSSPAPTVDKNGITVTYGPTTVLNKRLLKKVSETCILSATSTLQERWSTEDLAVSIQSEESEAIERLGFKAKYGDEAYKEWRIGTGDRCWSPAPAWTKEEEAKLEEGLKRYGWGDWLMIAGNYVKSQYARQCNDKALSKYKEKYKNKK